MDKRNATEIVAALRAQKHYVDHAVPIEDLVEHALHPENLPPDPFLDHRRKMQAAIADYYESIRTQVPCGVGNCMTRGCSAPRVLECWGLFKSLVS